MTATSMSADQADTPLKIRREGDVLVLSINNPAARNALSPELFAVLTQTVQEASDDESVRALVLTGEGSHFCSGGDLRRLAKRHEMTTFERRTQMEMLNTVVRSLRRCPKPVIAAVEGAAAGAGVSVALACDMVVAAQDSRFSVAYVKVGLVPDGGATAFLAESLSRPALAELCMTGNIVSGERMHQLGAVNRCTEAGQALTEALALAAQLADGPAVALARIKHLCNTAKSNTFDEQIELESTYMIEAQGGKEGREGIAAFLGKRKADFRSV